MKSLKIIALIALILNTLSAYSSTIEETIKVAVEQSLSKSLKDVKSAEIIEIATSLGETIGCIVSPLRCKNRTEEFDTVLRLTMQNLSETEFHCKISGNKKSSKVLIKIYNCKNLDNDDAFKNLLEGKSLSLTENISE